MAAKAKDAKTSTAPVENPLAAKLREAISAAFPGAKLVSSPKGNYYTVKVGKTSVGYVNGSRKIRVDFPKREGKREQLVVAKAGDVAKAVKTMGRYAPEAEPAK